MSQRVLKVGILGAGRIGRVHAETLAFRLPGVKLLAISDVNTQAARQVAERCGIPIVADSSAQLLAQPDMDAVLICSPTDTHASLIEQAANSGKHIFCEKPIAFNLEQIDRALDAVHNAGVKLQIGFNRRFDANFARVRQAVTTGEIGDPMRLHIVSRDPAPPPLSYIRVSGGIFMDMTIHDFDMARYLIGDEVEEIYVSGAVMVDPEIKTVGDLDTAVILLRFRNGVIGSIDNSRRAPYGYDQRVEILGSAGKIETSNRYPTNAVISSATSVYKDLPFNFFMDRYAESYIEEMRSFVDAVRENRPTLVSGVDGRMPAVMALAARRSHDERRPVRLEEIASAMSLAEALKHR